MCARICEYVPPVDQHYLQYITVVLSYFEYTKICENIMVNLIKHFGGNE